MAHVLKERKKEQNFGISNNKGGYFQESVKLHGLKAHHEYRQKPERMKFLRMWTVPARAFAFMVMPLKTALDRVCYAIA